MTSPAPWGLIVSAVCDGRAHTHPGGLNPRCMGGGDRLGERDAKYRN
jgi:hypothetical protein